MTNETQSLAVLLCRIHQSTRLCQPSHLTFFQIANREQRLRQLKLIELTQKITLILIRIPTTHQTILSHAIQFHRLLSYVMSGSHKISPQFQGFIQKYIKLDFTIAQHIRIGRSAAAILSEHIIYDTLLVQFTQIQHLKRNTQMLRHQHRIPGIVDPRAFILQGYAGIVPIPHK